MGEHSLYVQIAGLGGWGLWPYFPVWLAYPDFVQTDRPGLLLNPVQFPVRPKILAKLNLFSQKNRMDEQGNREIAHEFSAYKDMFYLRYQ